MASGQRPPSHPSLLEATMTSRESEAWTTVIESARAWHAPDLRGLWQYRDLVMLFVRRDSVATYKQTLLGPIWFVIQPLMTTIVFTVVFGHIVSVPTDGLSPFLFYFAGVLCWQYFAGNLTRTSDTFASNAAIYSKVYFPRLVTPISGIISNLIVLGIQFIVFVCVLLIYIYRGAAVQPNLSVILLPLLLLQIAALGLGTGLIISTMTTRYRDLTHMIGYMMQLWMYSTPIVYPLSQVPEKWLWLAYLNPMTATVQMFRYMLLGSGAPNMTAMAYSTAVTLIVTCIGLALFSRVERTFMDTI
ncbi:ABC transporter permease [Bradyrhizobium sp. ISRA442]|uniref:ABC transporter permease n=1 Tax=Bradyrhizobium sp. ISRA442 TaxID=2866197 RepID=UPI00311AC08A